MIAKVRQVLADFRHFIAGGVLPPQPVIEKPTTILANLIAAEILMGNFEITEEPADNRWKTTVTSEKFTIMIDSYFRVANDAEILTESRRGYLFHLWVQTPSVGFDANDIELIKQALKKRRWQEIQHAKADREFKEEQRALAAIENWMGIKPEPEPKQGE